MERDEVRHNLIFGVTISRMRRTIRLWLIKALRWLAPKPDLLPELRATQRVLDEAQQQISFQRLEARHFVTELIEAQAMAGSGPWHPGEPIAYAQMSPVLREVLKLKESGPVSTLGVYGDYEFLIQNIDWQREINYSWTEFSRWGVQQIILISRLYYIKNPIVRRLVDVCAAYVFARGVDISTQDEDANDVIKDFTQRNQKVLGHVALGELEKSKDRDGNLFFVFFTDPATGDVDIRTIDASEIQDVFTDPEDADVPQYYRRTWVTRIFDAQSGAVSSMNLEAWYPALGFVKPPNAPSSIKGNPINWDTPIYHRKVGGVGKWLFGCPRIYPMLDWAKEARKFLEACASIRQSLSQFAFTLTTKGGQAAIQGLKEEMQTTVGPASQLYDTNPPAVTGASFISGPGTKLEVLKTSGSTFSPEDVRQFKLMCCMVKGVPETFLADVSTGNLATAATLDRPTETVMLNLQEEWVEDLVVIYTFVLQASMRGGKSKLREAITARGAEPGDIVIRECSRIRLPDGRWRYAEAAKDGKSIDVQVNFPAIREGDVPAMVGAITDAMTLGGKSGSVVGIDEKEGVAMLYRALGNEKADELTEAAYPSKSSKDAPAYDPVRTAEPPEPPAPAPAPPQPQPAAPGPSADPTLTPTVEALRKLNERLARGLAAVEAYRDGTHASQ